MNAHYAGEAYRNARVTVGKTRQVVLLYEGMIKFVQQAKLAIEERRLEDRFNALSQAEVVILGLQGALDFKQGGDIAHTLYSFYAEILYLINEAQRRNDPKCCDDIIFQLKGMLDSWREIDRNAGATDTGAGVAAAPSTASDVSGPAAPERSASRNVNFSA